MEFTYPKLLKTIEELQKQFPFLAVCSIGKTWAGRNILSCSVGEGEESVLFVGGMNGQDIQSSFALLQFLQRLCTVYQKDAKIGAVKIRSTFLHRKVTVIPVLNPDGIEIARCGIAAARNYKGLVSRSSIADYTLWSANARGVLLYQNFDFSHDKIESPQRAFESFSAQDYVGPSPESERETKSLTDLCKTENYRCAYLFSSADTSKIYWSAVPDMSTDIAVIAKVLSSISDFPLCRKEPQERYGTFCEWFTNTYQKPAFEIQFQTAILEDHAAFVKLENLLTLGSIL